jgi:stage V sporulation protein SpoVS
MTVAEKLNRIHANIQVKLAQQGMPTDRETLEEVCTAIACLVRDPDSIELHTSPMSATDYTVVADCLALAARDFAEEIVALRALVATLEVHMQEEVRAWVASDLVSPTAAPHVIREMILSRFVSLDRELEGGQDAEDSPSSYDKRVD